MTFKALIVGFFFSCAYSSSIFLVNDSPFSLTAEVHSAQGILLAKENLNPGEQRNSNLDRTPLEVPLAPNASLTPYTVIWYCPNQGGAYSRCSFVSPGSLIRAGDCVGSFYCSPNKQKEKKS